MSKELTAKTSDKLRQSLSHVNMLHSDTLKSRSSNFQNSSSANKFQILKPLQAPSSNQNVGSRTKKGATIDQMQKFAVGFKIPEHTN